MDRYRVEIASNVNVKSDLKMYAPHDKIDYLDGDITTLPKEQLTASPDSGRKFSRTKVKLFLICVANVVR